MAKLATDVYVDGERYAAGEEAPEGVTNPAAFDADEWARDSLDAFAAPAPEPEVADDDSQADEAAEESEVEESESNDDDAPEAPPLNGPGSGRDAWVTFAESLGLEVTDDMGRDAIVAATRA